MALNGTLGFLGFGNMGGAILRGIIARKTLDPTAAVVYDVDEAKCEQARELGARVVSCPSDLARASDTLLLAVKPQNMQEALDSVKDALPDEALLISIAAGISTDYIRDCLGRHRRVVRVMPNTPALVGAGAAGIAASENCSGADAEIATTIFDAIGVTVAVPEHDIDAVTALSGSGPAYFFNVVEYLVKAAVGQGLNEDHATLLAAHTLLGAGRLLTESGESAATLRARVTSKGGTTEAALRAFSEQGLENVIRAGVDAAAERSRELGK